MAHGIWLLLIVFVLLLAAAGIGTTLQGRLRDHHRTSQTTDHVRLVVSILVTLTALVLSLLLSEVKGSFDTFDSRLRAFAGDLANLDVHLREYGDEAQPIRAMLRAYVAAVVADSWREESAPAGAYPRFAGEGRGVDRQQLGAMLVRMDVAIHRLDPPDGIHQRLAQALAGQVDAALDSRRSLIGTAQATVSWPLMVAMCAWLMVVFAVFGLLAPRNAVVHLTIVICAVCVASAIFLIDEYDSPLHGLMHVSSDALRDALRQIDEP
ncbi:hypothetical protein DFR50_10190 [Roseiarcus fermentans]|uniref:DUF4239 domain-containing protein n=1 Tax=Roseiarcus fermentans TaxID=1473586 RepID=A0A366FU77_9HYPH|nr:hypothetical protein [Roseiarcus fermentans]RBP18147.1 hypothetical protein DFR50_10190 [Roseiarcus fermentans]